MEVEIPERLQEPVSAALFGFEPVDTYSVSELVRYHPARERGTRVLIVPLMFESF